MISPNMKTKLFFLGLAAFQASAFAVELSQTNLAPLGASTTRAEPRIQFAETSFNFEKVQSTDKPQHDFIFTNTGTAMLEISDVRPACGCTTPGNWDRRVPPGKTGRIPLAFNPAHF